MSFWAYFTDPILRAPTLGCLLMCIAASLMGVILLMQRRLLIGELLSHAAYPGAIFGVLVLAFLGLDDEPYTLAAVLGGALVSSWLGLKAVSYLQRIWRVSSDASLCFILAVFFGVGVLLTSWLQGAYPMWAHQAKVFLFGQAATLTDEHVIVYGALVGSSVLFIAAMFRQIQALLFDRSFANAIGLRTLALEKIVHCFLLFSIVIGVRSVGVILMSGMLIAPAVAARQCSNRLKVVFWLAALFGGLSGWLGNVLSVEIALRYEGVHLPTGPAIVLVATCIALFALLFSPKRGVFFRALRMAFFRLRCLEENVLKGLWKRGGMKKQDLKRHYPAMLPLVLHRLIRSGWIVKQKNTLHLTADGFLKASAIVRLHRLWELYLTEQLGVQAERVHHSAEQMEHILTPELEARLTRLLANPEKDPHQQPIPQRRLF